MDKLATELVFLCGGRGELVEGMCIPVVIHIIDPVSQSSISFVSYAMGSARWKKFDRYTFKIHRHSDSGGMSFLHHHWVGRDSHAQSAPQFLGKNPVATFVSFVCPNSGSIHVLDFWS